ncbi:MAG: hypothetical protein HQL32_07860 [Planctomycetes bacterium]|nr:hypothetical protein [Planctomycetota bacterium]
MKEDNHNINIEKLGLLQLEEALKLCYKLFGKLFILLMLLFLFSGMSTIPQGKVAYIERWGQWQEEVHEAGFLLALPFFIDRIILFDTASHRHLSVNTFSTSTSNMEEAPASQKVLLTREGNLIHFGWTLTYKLSDTKKAYEFFGSSDLETAPQLLTSLIESISTEHCSRWSIDELLQGHERFRSHTQSTLKQKLLDLNSGLQVIRLDLQKPQVPAETQDAFDNVQRMQLGKESLKNDALGFASGLRQEVNASKLALLGQAQAEASSLKASLKAEAHNLEKIKSNYPDNEADIFLKLKLQNAIKAGLENNKDQSYVLKAGGTLRLNLGKDPIIKHLRDQDEQNKAKEAKQGGYNK